MLERGEVGRGERQKLTRFDSQHFLEKVGQNGLEFGMLARVGQMRRLHLFRPVLILGKQLQILFHDQIFLGKHRRLLDDRRFLADEEMVLFSVELVRLVVSAPACDVGCALGLPHSVRARLFVVRASVCLTVSACLTVCLPVSVSLTLSPATVLALS